MCRIRQVVVVMVVVTLGILGARPAAALQLCEQSIGSYYVNIAIKGSGFSRAFDDAFEVEIREVRPSKLEQVTQLQGFAYFDPAKYTWEKELNRYQLYKTEAGKPRQRVKVFAAQFPRVSQMRNEMRLRKADPGKFNTYLKGRLDYLGVLGVVYQGRIPTFDFLNGLDVGGSASAPDVLVMNADVALYRYALQAGISGVERDISEDELKAPGAMHTLLQRFNEQRVLWELPILQSNAGASFDADEILGKIGNLSIPGGIEANEVRPVYLSCLPPGMDEFGRAKAVFVPFKVFVGPNAEPFYPIMVFPTAFSSFETLNSVLRHEFYHARWWSAVNHLDSDVTTDAGFMREALLRASPAYLERSILEETAGTVKSIGNKMSPILFHERQVLRRYLDRLITTSGADTHAIPWTAPLELITPRGSGVEGKSLGQLNLAYDRLISEHVTNLSSWFGGAEEPANKKNMQLRLADLIVAGYHRPANGQLKYLESNFTSLDGLYGEMWKHLSTMTNAGAQGAVVNRNGKYDIQRSLLDDLRNDGNKYSDLQWLGALFENNRPLSAYKESLIVSRLNHLTEDLNVSYVSDLENVWTNSGSMILHADSALEDISALTKQIDILKNKINDAPFEVNPQNYAHLMIIDRGFEAKIKLLDELNRTLDEEISAKGEEKIRKQNELLLIQKNLDRIDITLSKCRSNMSNIGSIISEARNELADLKGDVNTHLGFIKEIESNIYDGVEEDKKKWEAITDTESGLTKLREEAHDLIEKGEDISERLYTISTKISDISNGETFNGVNENVIKEITLEKYNRVFEDLSPVLINAKTFYDNIYVKEYENDKSIVVLAKTTLILEKIIKDLVRDAAMAAATSGASTVVSSVSRIAEVASVVEGVVETAEGIYAGIPHVNAVVGELSTILDDCASDSECMQAINDFKAAYDEATDCEVASTDCDDINEFLGTAQDAVDETVGEDLGDNSEEQVKKRKDRKKKLDDRVGQIRGQYAGRALGIPIVKSALLESYFRQSMNQKSTFFDNNETKYSSDTAKEKYYNMDTKDMIKQVCNPSLKGFTVLRDYILETIHSTSEQGQDLTNNLYLSASFDLENAQKCKKNVTEFVAYRKVQGTLSSLEKNRNSLLGKVQDKISDNKGRLQRKITSVLSDQEAKLKAAREEHLKAVEARKQVIIDRISEILRNKRRSISSTIKKINANSITLGVNKTTLDHNSIDQNNFLKIKELAKSENERLSAEYEILLIEKQDMTVSVPFFYLDWARFALQQFLVLDDNSDIDTATETMKRRFDDLNSAETELNIRFMKNDNRPAWGDPLPASGESA